jgi:hypothetical protein
MAKESFEWDPEKDLANQTKHGVSFAEAQYAFADAHRVIASLRVISLIAPMKKGISVLVSTRVAF